MFLIYLSPICCEFSVWNRQAKFCCLSLWFYWLCCRATVREENPSGSSTRVLTLVTSAQAQPSISSYGPATSALHALRGQAASTASVNNGQLLLDLQLSSTAAASHCPLFDLQISSAAVSPRVEKQTQATGRKATSDYEDSTGSLNLLKNRDAPPVQRHDTQVPVLGIRSTRQRKNNQSKYQCLFICVSCDGVRCPFLLFNYALFLLRWGVGRVEFCGAGAVQFSLGCRIQHHPY